MFRAMACVQIMRICARLEVTPTIARVQLLLTDDFACVLDEADEIGLTS